MADATLSSAMDTFLTGGILTITQATANTGVMASTGYSLTGSNATSMVDIAGTWNTSGTVTLIKVNMTDTASNGNSRFLDFQIASTTKFYVQKTGSIVSAGGLSLGSGSNLDYNVAGLQLLDGSVIAFGTSTGGKIGTATGQKIGFWNATPVVQQVLATGGGATVDNVISFLQTIGLCKQS